MSSFNLFDEKTSNRQDQHEDSNQEEFPSPKGEEKTGINRYEFLKHAAGGLGGLLASTLVVNETYGFFADEKKRIGPVQHWSIVRAGEVMPEGWIKEKMQLDLFEGLTGNYDQISNNVNLKLFEKQERQAGTKVSNPLRGKERAWWAGEHEAFWKDAFIRTAFLVDAPEYKQRAHRWVEGILAAAQDDGYIGIYSKKGRFPSKGYDGELWTQSRIFQALLAYYEFTGEQRVLDAVEKAVSLTLKHYKDGTYFGRPNNGGGGIPHGVAFMDSLEWLYRLTGKDRYKEGAVWLYDDFSAHKTREIDMRLKNLLDEKKLWNVHTPHIMEGLHMPQICYAFTGDEKYRRAADNTLTKLDIHTNPGGGVVGNKHELVRERKGGGDQWGEYCSTTQGALTLNRILQYRKDLRVGDRVERGTLNHAQGARFHPVNRAAIYLASDNQLSADDPNKSNDRFVYAATHKAADCCTLNSTRLMPYYVDGMWYRATNPEALVANLYGPSRIKTKVADTNVGIVEKTDYPFSDQILFKINPDQPVHFTLMLRIPEAQNNLTVDVQGGEIKRFSDHLRISKKWRHGDTVRVDFNFKVELRKSNNGEAYYQRGPLVFAFQLPEIQEKSMEFKLGNDPSSYHRYLIKPQSTIGWKYKIDPKANFELVRLSEGNMKQPWAHPPLGLKGKMLNEKDEHVDVTLVPEGATHLRRVTFPLA